MSKFSDVLFKMEDLYNRKNADYGDSFSKNWKRFGTSYPIPRMYEKLDRIATLSKQGALIGETVEDTLLDLANMCVMTFVEIENEKEAKTKTAEQLNKSKKGCDKQKQKENTQDTLKGLLLAREMWSMLTTSPKSEGEKIVNEFKKHEHYALIPENDKKQFEFVVRMSKGETTPEEELAMALKALNEIVRG